MSDFSGCVDDTTWWHQSTNNVQIFKGNGVWVRPKGAVMAYIIVVGGGGGGGGGNIGNTSTQRGGGGGGGSGGVASIICPAQFLPGCLCVSVGTGGAGGSSNNAGSEGTLSVVYDSQGLPDTVKDRILASGTATAGGGSSYAGSFLGGAGSTIATDSNTGPFISLGRWQCVAGDTGGNGGDGATGASVSLPLNTFVSGGAGGGGITAANVSYSGGGITGAGKYAVSIPGGRGYTEPEWDTLPGSPGFAFWQPLLFSGGAGGGAGGLYEWGECGGAGAVGSGGGGGGAGYAGAAAGAGGCGGNGMVIVISW